MAVRLTLPKIIIDPLLNEHPECREKCTAIKTINVTHTQLVFTDRAKFTYVWGTLINHLRELWVEEIK